MHDRLYDQKSEPEAVGLWLFRTFLPGSSFQAGFCLADEDAVGEGRPFNAFPKISDLNLRIVAVGFQSN